MQEFTQSVMIGIDEVGRGPLAGPVMVGVAYIPANFDWSNLPGVTDSKKLTPKKRLAVYNQAFQLRRKGLIDYEVAGVSAAVIDGQGIVPSITSALEAALGALECRHRFKKHEVMVRLDGGLRAPIAYKWQETIVQGDLHEPVIGLASIMAKVTRDTYMVELARDDVLAPYDFARHKGYGTKDHRAAIVKYGLSPHHRATFCRSLLT